MGYYSEVAIKMCVKGKDAPRLEDFLNKDVDGTPLGLDLIKEADVDTVMEYNAEKEIYERTIAWYIVKWYNDYVSVLSINQAMDKIRELIFDDNPEVLGLQFIRLGEDITDVEEFYDGEICDSMYVSRAIELNN